MQYTVRFVYEGSVDIDVAANNEDQARELAWMAFENLEADVLNSNIEEASIDWCFEN